MIETAISVFDYPYYARLAAEKRGEYAEAKPFPHIQIPNFLPGALAVALAASFPGPGSDQWVKHDNERANRWMLGDETKFDPLLRSFAQTLRSRRFLLFLETLTSVPHLIGDPYYIGGGAMLSGRGDKLEMHTDFNWHGTLALHHRVNALLYLTPNWDTARWGGGLRLEDDNGEGVTYDPLFNSLVVFNTDEHSWHGQPSPMECPNDVYRRVLNVFYYTSIPKGGDVPAHNTRYRSPYAEKPAQDYEKEGI